MGSVKIKHWNVNLRLEGESLDWRSKELLILKDELNSA
jgi:hypothetical protein